MNFDSNPIDAYYCAPMSESPVPPYVDTRKAFRHERKIAGELDIQRLPRFQQRLASTAGSVNIDLSFGFNPSRWKVITGKVQAKVEVICQRCLEATVIELEDDINLALIRDEADIEKLDSGLEPWLSDEFKLDIAALIEEQLMLCMPIVSYHENENCATALEYTSVEASNRADATHSTKENPFSVLKLLKKSDLKD